MPRQTLLWAVALTVGIGMTSLLIAQSGDSYAAARARLVDTVLKSGGITNPRVLSAMGSTPRHEFVNPDQRNQAYYDKALPIGGNQTISSPYIVAVMTQELDPQPNETVLEIGTGSGYQAAVLSPLVKDVYSIEIVPELGERAAKVLQRLNYANVHTKVGDGFKGWAEHAPFDKIIVTCSPEDVPQPLVDQLADGGLMIIPVGERYQQTLMRMRKKGDKLEREALRPTLFVPMTGAAEDARKVKADPKNPTIINGDFEETPLKSGDVPGWYYQRGLTWNTDKRSPSGDHFITFNNEVAGSPTTLLQGFAVDGEFVQRLRITASVRTEKVSQGQAKDELRRSRFSSLMPSANACRLHGSGHSKALIHGLRSKRTLKYLRKPRKPSSRLVCSVVSARSLSTTSS